MENGISPSLLKTITQVSVEKSGDKLSMQALLSKKRVHKSFSLREDSQTAEFRVSTKLFKRKTFMHP